ncbi:hypothetical protein, conserved [Eimeria acervulina]|uniref:Carrier domain-containing protein n=1 Tax=Eimeria acervulina TaxID=5801 RepID=U6GLT9_EIMAC|nr:hypothetical protein, conserved [Eimeria acervulina]CDI80263.1 hypothetical protein, conserved [Eimeria acervulina]
MLQTGVHEDITSNALRDHSLPFFYNKKRVSRQLVELAQKYCKEGAEVSASHKFECLQTREERPWDCLDTVEFVLDDVVDFIVKAGEAQRKGAADEEKKN